MSKATDVFWDDLAEELKEPEFLRDFIVESIRIRAIDNLMNQLELAREQAGITKAEIARSINARPEAIRRLLSNKSSNPTLGTLAEVAAVLGFEVSLTPLTRDQRAITVALRDGAPSDLEALRAQLTPARS